MKQQHVLRGILLLTAASGCPSRFEVQDEESFGSTSTSAAETSTHADTMVSDSTASADTGCAPVGDFPSFELTTTVQVHAGGELNFNSALAVGDFDGDGVHDVAVVWGEFDVLHLSNISGVGDGLLSGGSTATPEGFLPLGAGLAAARIDTDGLDDLVVSSGEGALLAAFLGTTDGGLSVSDSLETAATHRISGIDTADHGADGTTDIFVAGTVSDGVVGIVNGDGVGGLAAGASVDLPGYFPSDVVAADLDNDSFPEVMVATADIFSEGLERLFLFDGTSSGFGAQTSLELPHGTGSLAVLDVDMDGRLDVAVVNGEGIQLFHTRSDRSLVLGDFIEEGGSSPVVADFNQDGYEDLTIVTSDGISILAGNGCGLGPVASVPFAGLVGIAVADMNASGTPDLVLMTPQSVLVFLAAR